MWAMAGRELRVERLRRRPDQGVFTLTHRIDENRGELQVGFSQRNPIVAIRDA